MYQNLIFQHYLPDVVSALSSGHLRAVYDGSFDSGYGTTAWCINSDGSIIRGVSIVHIKRSTLDVTHCDLAGIYYILRIIKFMTRYYQIDSTNIELGSYYDGGLAQALLNSDKTPLRYIH